MSFLPNLNLSFIHIPKTGGNSLTTYFKDIGASFNIGHTPISDIYDRKVDWVKSNWPENYDSLIRNSFKVSVVRHPYDRIRSYYCFLKQKQLHDIGDLSFHDFVFETPAEIAMQVAWYSQTQYLYYNQSLAVDRVIRFEHFIEEFKQIFSERNAIFDMQLHNLQTNSHKILLTKDIKIYLYKKYKDDFVNFEFQP
jgi:hypothetical protein